MKNKWLTALICVIIAVTFFAAGFFTNVLVNILNPQYEIQFSQNVSRENIINFNRVKALLLNSYYQDIDENVLLEGAIKGMVDAVGDPYTVYYTPELMKSFMEQQQGSYVGIGVTVFMDEDGLATVSEVFDGSPAKEAGMRNGDKVVTVDGEDVTSLKDLDLVVQKIRGPVDTQVDVTVYRPEINNYVELSMVRREIKLSNIFN